MENKNSNGSSSSMVVRLPPGFRFHPTDEELVVQYLKRKVFSCPLPASIIPDLPHLYSNSDPWDLPGDAEQERYFFSTKEAKYPNGNRSNRATNSGYWKATGLDKQVLSSCKNKNQHHQVVVVGMKKTLVFYRGKPPHGSRTDWIMHEYRLLPHPAAHPLPNWVLCRIFLKRRGAAAAIAIASKEVSKKNNSSSKVVFYDFFLAHNNNSNSNSAPASSSSATCSVITDLSTNDDNDSSSTNTFPFSYFTYK